MTKSDTNPYESLPEAAFWRSAVAEASPFELRNVYRKKFDISDGTKIATAGSCFAQHISRYFRYHGYNVLDVEPAPCWLPQELHAQYGYSIYSARYGNIYTIPQLLQLAREVIGEFEPDDIAWTKQGKIYDALRPAVEPDGFETIDEMRAHRQFHIGRVRHLLMSMDVLIFTLGLTEVWQHRRSGTVYPTAPGVYAGAFDTDEYEFVNSSYAELDRYFRQFIDILHTIRGGNVLRIILTVSPVPLTATAAGVHVLQATTYSKSVLRALAGSLCSQFDFIDYFPSYEIVLNQGARGLFFEHNLRSVTRLGVEVVMREFFSNHKPLTASTAEKDNVSSEEKRESPIERMSMMQIDNNVQCEEAILAAFGR